VLQSVDPIRARCDCPDFLRNSLGLCKHVLVVLEAIHAKPTRLRRALKEQSERAIKPVPGLQWTPIRPLRGLGDWLERVSWSVGLEASSTPSTGSKWFRRTQEGWTLRSTYPDKPAKRLDLVEALLELVPNDPRAARHDPALRALLLGEKERLRRVLESSLSPSELRSALKGLKKPLYPYQRQGVESFLTAGRLLLADDMGLGKTAQAITCCHALHRAGRVRRGLIIAPAALKPQWAREWMLFTDLPITVIDGVPDERHAVYRTCKEGFFIINYEQLLRDLDVVRGWKPDLVVLDEAQRIKNWATKTALSVKGLTPPYRLVLTGTPMENRIDELASIIEWVDDQALEPKWRLSALHAVRADGRHEITGVRELDTLRTRLHPCMVRRVRQEVLDQLPPRTDTRVPIDMTEEQKGEHDALIPSIAALVALAKRRPLTQQEFLRLMSLLTTQRIISNGLAQLYFESMWPTIRPRKADDAVLAGLSAPKLAELRQLVRQVALEQDRKIVVFSQWRRMLTLGHWAVADLLAEEKLRAGFFTGQEGQKRRTQNIVEFHDDPRFRLLFASDAGGVGLNLQRASNCVINLELPWNPAVLEQRIGRVYRLGQEQPIDVYNLVSEYGIESRIAGLVAGKQAFFKGLFDGSSDSVQFEQSGSFLERVEKLLDLSKVPGGKTSAAIVDVEIEDIALDDEVVDPFEELVEAGDESRDVAAAASANGDQAPAVAVVPEPEPAVTEPPTAGEVRRLFAQLQIRREPASGKVVIEAPGEAASTLSALFEGMAALLRSAGEGS
jgi:SNF2 family DNA or RNA helicase